MSRTRVKFCGITRIEDVRAAVEAGADAVGLVFDPQSRRAVTLEWAVEIRAAVPPFVESVALFRNAPAERVAAVIHAVRPGLLQFHGEESAQFCAGFGCPYLKAVPMAKPQDIATWERRYADARALLLDAHAGGAAGGTGQAFDWTRVPRQSNKPLVLAGGLTAENVGAAITIARPYAVDVSSGIESVPGIKDPQRMFRFIEEVRRADAR